jgi:hypothetical protein
MIRISPTKMERAMGSIFSHKRMTICGEFHLANKNQIITRRKYRKEYLPLVSCLKLITIYKIKEYEKN